MKRFLQFHGKNFVIFIAWQNFSENILVNIALENLELYSACALNLQISRVDL